MSVTTPWRNALWVLALLIFLGFGAGSLFLPVTFSPEPRPVRLTLTPGLSTRAIGLRLRGAGVIRSSDAFAAVALFSGHASRLKAGTYDFQASESLRKLVERMARGDVVRMAVTIPEGFNSREIATRVAPILGCLPAGVTEAVEDPALRDSLGVGEAPGLEGYLFPDTYELIPGGDPRRFVARLVGRMIERFAQKYAARAESLGLSRHDVLTLASLVEAEAAVDEERPRIAAVFLNRLRSGMKLQSDPTVAYVLGRRPDRIYTRDLEVNSPYNTYRVTGLPPGPICSPGESSIEAVLHPLADCRDYYFVATGDGRHLFSATNDDHNEARRRVGLLPGGRSPQEGE